MDPYREARRRLENALERSPLKRWGNARLQAKTRRELLDAINKKTEGATHGELELFLQVLQKITREDART